MDREDIHKLTVYIIRKGNWKMKNRILSTVSAIALSCSAAAAIVPVSASAEMKNADVTVVKEDHTIGDGIETSYQIYNDGTVRVISKSIVDVELTKDNISDFSGHIYYDKSLYSMEMLDGLDCYASYKPFADNSTKSYPLVFDYREHKLSDTFDTTIDILVRNYDGYPDKLSKGDILLDLKFSLVGELDNEGTYIDVNSCGFHVNSEMVTILPDSTDDSLLWYDIERDNGFIYECSIKKSGVIDYVIYNADPMSEPNHEGSLYNITKSFGFRVPDGYTVSYDFASTVQGIGIKNESESDEYRLYYIGENAFKPDPKVGATEPKAEKGAFFWARLTPKDRTEFNDISFTGLNTISGEMLKHIDSYSHILSGDANCDGKVNLSDAVLIMQSLSNPSKYKLTEQGNLNADCTSKISLKKSGDGVTNMDALTIQQYALELIDSLPYVK